jgi:hypothetical protein
MKSYLLTIDEFHPRKRDWMENMNTMRHAANVSALHKYWVKPKSSMHSMVDNPRSNFSSVHVPSSPHHDADQGEHINLITRQGRRNDVLRLNGRVTAS